LSPDSERKRKKGTAVRSISISRGSQRLNARAHAPPSRTLRGWWYTRGRVTEFRRVAKFRNVVKSDVTNSVTQDRHSRVTHRVGALR